MEGNRRTPLRWWRRRRAARLTDAPPEAPLWPGGPVEKELERFRNHDGRE